MVWLKEIIIINLAYHCHNESASLREIFRIPAYNKYWGVNKHKTHQRITITLFINIMNKLHNYCLKHNTETAGNGGQY